MSQTGKQSPLGVNVDGSILQDKGLCINPVAQGYMGVSKTNFSYTMGSIVGNTCLKLLTYAINDAWTRGECNGGVTVPKGTYNNLIYVGQGTSEALGNARPPTYTDYDPSGRWPGIATTGYGNDVNPMGSPELGQGQEATWYPYTAYMDNHSVTQWGYNRLHALQAWNEFNWNGIPAGPNMPEYKDYTASFLTCAGFVDFADVAINAMKKGQTWLKGTYSNMNDLISADITNVTLATAVFGQDCITAGRAIDLKNIAKFGMPSCLLQNIRKNKALTQSLTLALISAGLTNEEIDFISKDLGPVTKKQEQQIYGAFLVITGADLSDILIPMNCKTAGLASLADLLNIKKLFPNSYRSLTVPIYNTTRGPTNSKTFYPIFSGDSVNSSINSAAIKATVGTIIPEGEPPIIPLPPPLPDPPPAQPVTAKPSNNSGGMFGGLRTPAEIKRKTIEQLRAYANQLKKAPGE